MTHFTLRPGTDPSVFMGQERIDYALAFVGGVMMAVAVAELLPEAIRLQQSKLTVLGITISLRLLFVVLSTLYARCTAAVSAVSYYSKGLAFDQLNRGSISGVIFGALIIIPILGQMLHFYLDGLEWRFRGPTIRERNYRFLVS